MKSNKFIILLLIFAFANAGEVFGQEDQEGEVIIFLKNGSQFQAKIIEWDPAQDVVKLEAFGNIIEFRNSDIKKIVQADIQFGHSYNFKEEGYYYQIRANLITGNSGDRSSLQPGIGISAAAGKRFNRKLSLGVGVSFDEYIARTSENILSVFGEVSGYVSPDNLSLSYSLAAGYGFAFENEEVGLMDATGGLMVYPAVGFRWGQKHLKWTLDFGYKFQEANWLYESWGTISDQRILYRRLTIRTGVMF